MAYNELEQLAYKHFYGVRIKSKESPYGEIMLARNDPEKGSLPHDAGMGALLGKPVLLSNSMSHRRIMRVDQEIPIRSHEETNCEFVINIGKNSFTYVLPDRDVIIKPGETFQSVNNGFGFYHGFKPHEGPFTMIVTKIIHKDFIDKNDEYDFIQPTNSFIN